MNKRKILTLALSLCMVAILAVGTSLAYLTDEDYQENCFTVGNVAIDLWEDFGDNQDNVEKLLPAVGDENKVEKEIYVDNTGSELAYVRIHFAIPTVLDSGDDDDPAFAAFNNILHWNFSKDSIADGQWNWGKSADAANYPGNGGEWNTYTQVKNNVTYTVYVATYETPLAVGATTPNAVHTVYLDSKIDNEQITALKEKLGEKWMIKVFAEACQAEGFTDAYTALNTSFGTPEDDYADDMIWDGNTESQGKAFVDYGA